MDKPLEERVAQLEAVVRVVMPDWYVCQTCIEDIRTNDNPCHAVQRAAYLNQEPTMTPEPQQPEGADGPEGD